MKLLGPINADLLQKEKRNPYVYPEPRVNPSDLSAYYTHPQRNRVVGRCARQTAFKLFGVPVTEPMKPQSARVFRCGRYMENEIADGLKASGLFVAAGVRTYVPDLVMSLELDIISFDPETMQALIVENKTIKGQWAANDVMAGRPKPENLMQICMYLDLIRTGAKLKELIAKGLEDRDIAEEFGDYTMNRIEVIPERVAKLDEGPVAGKLLYQDRESCGAYELDIGLYRHPTTGFTHATVDGVPNLDFTLESVYQRRREIQAYWAQIVAEAEGVLAGMGITRPQAPRTAFGVNYNDPAYKAATSAFWAKVGEYFQSLPPSRWPAPDYEFKYSPERLADLKKQGLLKKTEITAMNKGERIGDFNCDYCDWQKKCVAARYPEYRNMLVPVPAPAPVDLRQAMENAF